MKKKMKYETPVIEMIEVSIEKGFATSGGGVSGNDDYDGTAEIPPFTWG